MVWIMGVLEHGDIGTKRKGILSFEQGDFHGQAGMGQQDVSVAADRTRKESRPIHHRAALDENILQAGQGGQAVKFIGRPDIYWQKEGGNRVLEPERESSTWTDW